MDWHIDVKRGRLAAARQQPSPNQDARPDPTDIDLLILHGISLPPGEFGGRWIEDLFLNRLDPDADPYFAGIHRLRVSAHLLVRRDGRLIQFVPFHRRAWHAGVSCWRGRKRCNDYSIGIELEGTDDTPYDDRQYRTLEHLLPSLRAAYPGITAERIVGHSDVAPGRKTDPGPAFDWQRLRRSGGMS
ncbi:1,6-anhydro-N-acetylmuramyl-L-alanine amidase AmpD [Methylonatrum kenyense]|uniref:1,6-anhydro-N-acetylmuramyl-L-alanine amidase AmpD n=1 Tax=Methylonatrum kenyense TaxID=455253 RepID=UPI0020BFDA84|nr:1,6-anhydro-N-acetylmuramyl-L-alanine amidase AmpD [Methylonatrum kenyense]MCK8516565.1 1,6-anhydro-N-acetylmuramyl-L-alanine amidase AmpD [Methylonatrum kenyense]